MFPHVADVSALSICLVLSYLLLCCLWVCCMLGFGQERVLVFWLDVHGKCGVVLFVVTSCLLCSAVPGVKNVHVVLSGLRMRLLFVPVYVFPVGLI